METECDGNVGEISKSMSSIGVYLIFYTFNNKKRENNGAISPKSLFILCVFPPLAGQSKQAVQSGDRGCVQHAKPDRRCDIWGHIYYLIYYLKAADSQGCSISI